MKILRRKNDEWTKNWIARMKWYGAQMHDVSIGKPTKKEFSGDISSFLVRLNLHQKSNIEKNPLEQTAVHELVLLVSQMQKSPLGNAMIRF